MRIENVFFKKKGDKEYCFATITSDLINEISFVPTVEESGNEILSEDTENGYQRPGQKSRMKKFKEWLCEGGSKHVIPPIILSSRGNWNFEKTLSHNYGKLIINGKAAILDGQHRLGGFWLKFQEEQISDSIDIIVVLNYSIEEERTEFNTINSNAKGVHSALRDYNNRDTDEYSRISLSLNDDSDSPFKDRISKIGALDRRHLFNLATVSKNIKRLFNHGSLKGISEDQKLRITKDFFGLISEIYEDEWSDIENLKSNGKRSDFEYKLLEATGLIAWCLIGQEILSRCFKNEELDDELMKEYIEKVGKLDWKKDGDFEGRTGEAGARKIYELMQVNLS